MSLSTLLQVAKELNSKKQKPGNDLVYKAVMYIEDALLTSIRPRPKTITSFIKGSESSPFYRSFFINHEDVCGMNINITLEDVTNAIDELILEGRLKTSGNELSVNRTIQQVHHQLDSIFENRNRARKTGENELLLMSKWNGTHKGAKQIKSILTNDGYLFPCDSEEEVSVIKKLNNKLYYKKLRGQTFSITYMRNGTRLKQYYPDIVMLTHDNHIALMEVKQLKMMSYFEYILKYQSLRVFCENKGYLYTMCDRTFKTFEDLKRMKVNSQLKRKFNDVLLKTGSFDKIQFILLTQGMSTKQKLKTQIELTALTIQKNLRNKSLYNFDIKHNDFLIT